IDVQEVDPRRSVRGLAGRYFSPAETAALLALPPAEHVAAFYRCWTRKEAYIKACGTGLALPLDDFDVAFEPGRAPALLRSTIGPDEPRRWVFAELPRPDGFEAALAVEGGGWRPIVRDADPVV